jgi:spoIIIJ-associated protein
VTMAKKQTPKDIVQTKLDELLSLMLTPVSFEIEEGEDSIQVHIESSEESGLLIGKYGKTIEALELILNLMVKQEMGEWTRVVLNIADWKEKQEERLASLAENVVSRVKETGTEQFIYNLSSAQRRTVHMLLSENTDVETLSDGEGQERYLIVRPRAK